MPAWLTQLRERIEYVAFRFVAAVFTALPMEVSAEFSGWWWGLIAPLLPRHRRALDNLAHAFPDMPLDERERIAREMWKHLGRTFGEFFHLPQILAEQRIDLTPLETFAEVASTAPFVVCVPHMGNWEIASQAGMRFGVPIAGTYQALTNPLVDRWLLEKRKIMYAGGLFAKSASTAQGAVEAAPERRLSRFRR